MLKILLPMIRLMKKWQLDRVHVRLKKKELENIRKDLLRVDRYYKSELFPDDLTSL